MAVIMDLVPLFLMLSAAGAGFYWVLSSTLSTRKKAYLEAVRQLDDFVDGLSHPKKEYRFYTVGHPYVWVDTSYEDIIKSLEMTAINPRTPLPTAFRIDVDESRKAIFYVDPYRAQHVHKNTDHLMLYEDWIEEGEKYSERIREYKESKNS